MRRIAAFCAILLTLFLIWPSSALGDAASATKTCYFTIDDGPSRNTQKILDVLKRHDVPVTFFLIGKNVMQYPDVTKEIYARGHAIGYHSHTHDYNKIYKNASALLADVQAGEKTIKDVLGKDFSTNLFRFPGGSSFKRASPYKKFMIAKGYRVFDWNVVSGDATTSKTADEAYRMIVKTVGKQKTIIVLVHDFPKKLQTLNSLDRTITYLKHQGFTFKTLEEYPK